MAMEFDAYDYLEKTVAVGGDSGQKPDKEDPTDGHRRSSRRHHENGGHREKEREREKEKEKDRHHRGGGHGERDRDRERERERRGETERGGSKSRRHEKEVVEREHEGERRSSSRSRRHGREEVEREQEREMTGSGSRSRRHERDEVEREHERGRSRDRAIRERELERDLMGSRKIKEKKEEEPEVDLERDQRTVFAFQMPMRASERDVYEFFSKAGKVRDVRLIMDRKSRRSRGVGYIEFYDAMSVPMAIALTGQLLLGQPIMVKPSEAEKNLVPSTASVTGAMAARKIYVGNLDYNITEDMLRQVFESFGPVELIQLPREPETGHCKGYGFIQFAQAEHAKAAQTLNEKVQIAGRSIKVSSVTDHVGVGDAVTNAADLDDDEGGGLSLNAHARAMLMQRLDRTGTASSIAGSLAVPGLNGSVANQQVVTMPVTSQSTIPMSLPLASPLIEPIGQPSECILLKNMFDPSTETEPDFDLDIKEEVEEECSKFGQVKHIYVDKNTQGHVYMRFDSIASASNCQRAMHGRWYARRCIAALYMRPEEYEAKFRGSS